MVEKEKIKHIGIIADGSRRWASERNLPAIDGYKKTLEKVFTIPKYFFEKGVQIVSIFIFPQTNWQRDQGEINELMKLIDFYFKNELEGINKRGWRILISGQIEELPGNLEEECHDLMNKTKSNANGTLNLYINYDGRQEILGAVKKLLANKISPEQVHEGLIRKYLYHGGLNDPEFVICTGGEKKTSGFQLWQTINSEIIFSNKYWPDFEEIDVEGILGRKIKINNLENNRYE